MNLDSIGEVIARRELYIAKDDGPNQEVIVLVGKPQPFPDLRDYYCPYQILVAGKSRIRYAAGIDTVQALELAFRAIGGDLYALNQANHDKLRWLDETTVNFGFPPP
jgi:hypothetical protein